MGMGDFTGKNEYSICFLVHPPNYGEDNDQSPAAYQENGIEFEFKFVSTRQPIFFHGYVPQKDIDNLIIFSVFLLEVLIRFWFFIKFSRRKTEKKSLSIKIVEHKYYINRGS